MSSPPATQTALVCAAAGQYRLDEAVPVPAQPPAAGMLLCAVRAVALNPADWKMLDFAAAAAADAALVGGQEFAGEVVAVGPGVDPDRFRPGDRVLAPVPGLNTFDGPGGRAGAFCHYTLVAADMACRMPPALPFADAAGLSVVTCTAALALYQALGLPLPPDDGSVPPPADPPVYVLVSGGASATGTMAIQLLKASGLSPLATCSPENGEMLRRLGAVATFDYHAPTCGMEIRNYTANRLAHVLDCVTQAESMALAYDAIGPAGGRYVALDPFPARIQYARRDIAASWVMGLSLFGAAVRLAGTFGRPPRPQDRAFTAALFRRLERMLARGALQPHPVELRAGGLPAVPQGIEDLRMGRVRARKLVYTV